MQRLPKRRKFVEELDTSCTDPDMLVRRGHQLAPPRTACDPVRHANSARNPETMVSSEIALTHPTRRHPGFSGRRRGPTLARCYVTTS
jgi:hypothetical protein